jgi:Reverse transcriptase (RNA-dependent DNA polymerase)
VLNKRKAVLTKFKRIEAEHSSKWFKQSSNKEADERGSRASVSVLGLRKPEDPTASKKLADMVKIARLYYNDLHTPLDYSQSRKLNKKELLEEVKRTYNLLPPPPHPPPDGEFDLSEIKLLLKKMPPMAPGPDGIPYPFWKALAKQIESHNERNTDNPLPTFWETFMNLANWLRINGTNSHGFKDANISLFFKKGDPTLVSNYRPISSMNTDCKLYTNLINARLSPWAESKLHQDQKGFMPNRLITDHTRLASEVFHLANSTGHNSYLISLDQSKAYDRVDQTLLLETLACMGLPPSLVKLISDVLHQPCSRVCINSGYS